MTNLVEAKNNQVITTSFLVAEKFEKEHRNILENIRKLKDEVTSAENSADLFCKEIQKKDSYGRTQPAFEFNKDFFTLLVMGFTGEKALKFKIDYINAFNKMEKELNNKFIVQPSEPLFGVLKLNPLIFGTDKVQYLYEGGSYYFKSSEFLKATGIQLTNDLIKEHNIMPYGFFKPNFDFGFTIPEIAKVLDLFNKGSFRNELFKEFLNTIRTQLKTQTKVNCDNKQTKNITQSKRITKYLVRQNISRNVLKIQRLSGFDKVSIYTYLYTKMFDLHSSIKWKDEFFKKGTLDYLMSKDIQYLKDLEKTSNSLLETAKKQIQ